MDYTLKLGLRKPSLDELVDVNDLNYNMDVLDSHTHTPEEIGAATADSFTAHLADEMPHQFTSTNKTYRYGFKAQDNHLIFTYEEVV